MPTIRLNLTQLPPSARRRSIQLWRKPETIATFIRHNQWTETSDIVHSIPATALGRLYATNRPNGEALICGYGVILLPNGKTAHRLLIVHGWVSELQQTRVGLEKITASYLQQLAGTEVLANIHLTELADDFDTEPNPQIRSRKLPTPDAVRVKADTESPSN
jgi:hypothetical protein